MARMGKFNVDGLKELQKKLNRLDKEKEQFIQSCAKELAARLLKKVVKRTPVGDYADVYDVEDDGEQKFLVMSDKKGGTLRRGWNVGEIRKEGSNYVIDVSNSVEYASFVEYGHRQTPGRYVPAINKRLKRSWVPGQFMMTISEQEIKQSAPKILEKRMEDFLRSAFDD